MKNLILVCIVVLLSGCNPYGALEPYGTDYDSCFDRKQYMSQSITAVLVHFEYFSEEKRHKINEMSKLTNNCDNFAEYIMLMARFRRDIENE